MIGDKVKIEINIFMNHLFLIYLFFYIFCKLLYIEIFLKILNN